VSETPGMLVVMAGLPGSGKSRLAQALAGALPALVLDKDRVRAALFPAEEIEYSQRQDDLVMGILLQAAQFLLAKGRSVVIDGRPFALQAQMEPVAACARQAGAPLKVILCECPQALALARLEHDRASGTHPAQDRDAALYERLRRAGRPAPAAGIRWAARWYPRAGAPP